MLAMLAVNVRCAHGEWFAALTVNARVAHGECSRCSRWMRFARDCWIVGLFDFL